MPPALPPVTILMACHQGAAHLQEQLDTIAAQRGVDWRLVASDDGSTDGTAAILQAFRASHPDRVRLRQGPRRGGRWGASMHFLDLLCDPDVPDGPVALSDQDDLWYPEKLKQALLHLENAQGPAIYSARSRHVTEDGRPLGPSRSFHGAASFGNALVENRVSGHSAVLTAAALRLVRSVGPVEVPFHDWWLYLLLTGAGGEVIHDARVMLDYRQHGGNVLGAPRGALSRLARLSRVFGPEGPAMQRANRAALLRALPFLTPETRALLAALDMAPRCGPLRALRLTRLGVKRFNVAADTVLHLAATLGRV
ncbi:glycosyltransferase [Sagittula sp. S175]|uniref:glycosyltransferase n=1 Tax=Sagittula sp. S175 TaxID=3415129 RepID=UPI003C7C3698